MFRTLPSAAASGQTVLKSAKVKDAHANLLAARGLPFVKIDARADEGDTNPPKNSNTFQLFAQLWNNSEKGGPNSAVFANFSSSVIFNFSPSEVTLASATCKLSSCCFATFALRRLCSCF